MSCRHEWSASASARSVFCTLCGVRQAGEGERLGRYPPLPEPPTKPTVVDLPKLNVIAVVAGLRKLADSIERGDLAVHDVAWVGAGPDGIAVGSVGPQANRFAIAGMFQAAALRTVAKVEDLP